MGKYITSKTLLTFNIELKGLCVENEEKRLLCQSLMTFGLQSFWLTLFLLQNFVKDKHFQKSDYV